MSLIVLEIAAESRADTPDHGLGFAAIAVNELLVCAGRCLVGFRYRINQFEVLTKGVVHTLRTVANDVEAATLVRPTKPE